MSSQYDRRQVESKQSAYASAAKKAAELRSKEATKRAQAAKAQDAAARTSSTSTARMKAREATSALDAANKYGKDAAAEEKKAARYAAEAAALQAKIAKVDAAESQKAARQQAIALRAAEEERRRTARQIAATQASVVATDAKAEAALRAINAPKVENLRILMLGASSEGDLRVTREHTRIRRAVEAALHRDQVEIEVRLSATTQDLQEGIAKFRPHVVHFSGHGDEQLISFEEDLDDFHAGVVVTAGAFASACEATDQPPTLVVFNACSSAGTADALVQRFAPLAIGMAGNIEDGDALYYAAALYSSIANGQSVRSAHMAGKAAIELSGGDHHLPYLAEGPGVDASAVMLVRELEE